VRVLLHNVFWPFHSFLPLLPLLPFYAPSIPAAYDRQIWTIPITPQNSVPPYVNLFLSLLSHSPPSRFVGERFPVFSSFFPGVLGDLLMLGYFRFLVFPAARTFRPIDPVYAVGFFASLFLILRTSCFPRCFPLILPSILPAATFVETS